LFTRALIATAAILVAASAFAAPQTYVTDPYHSFAHFSVSHFGMTTIMGRFDKMSAKIVLDQAAKTGSIDARIVTASVNTGDAKREGGGRSRDEHLRTADFFNVAEFPDMTFKSTRLNFKGDAVESVDGNLTMVGVTKPLKLNVTSFNCGPHPVNKKPMCGAVAEGVIKRTDWGMKYGVPAIGDDVKLVVNLEAYHE
jgi:polyisoprenoid-binding protein YceI